MNRIIVPLLIAMMSGNAFAQEGEGQSYRYFVSTTVSNTSVVQSSADFWSGGTCGRVLGENGSYLTDSYVPFEIADETEIRNLHESVGSPDFLLAFISSYCEFIVVGADDDELLSEMSEIEESFDEFEIFREVPE